MRALLFTSGSPFARAVRIILDEIGLDYERREEIGTPTAEQRAATSPTLQVPTFWDGDLTLWESGIIAEYLMSTYAKRPSVDPPFSMNAFRPDALWQDKLIFSTIQTFGTAATTISQMKWTGVAIDRNDHLARAAQKLIHILGWLDAQLADPESGFQPGCVSMQDIFLAAHVRFVQARPLGIDLELGRHEKVAALLNRLNQRDSFKANPIWWWEPGIIGYEPDGTPVFGGDT
ncbi:glutathione S-transferase family protein [uncultured Nitratireductor sp.]|uniref:glutathione S-transferase family protein n=1 Tax=uncultured Nitratireductor sp. TaxID=520953 RepID=UPI0025E1B898|nr:glutathione S-transferase family protein [uncultured Nitratireductor sp.]